MTDLKIVQASNGRKMYFKNGKIISKEKYLQLKARSKKAVTKKITKKLVKKVTKKNVKKVAKKTVKKVTRKTVKKVTRKTVKKVAKRKVVKKTVKKVAKRKVVKKTVKKVAKRKVNRKKPRVGGGHGADHAKELYNRKDHYISKAKKALKKDDIANSVIEDAILGLIKQWQHGKALEWIGAKARGRVNVNEADLLEAIKRSAIQKAKSGQGSSSSTQDPPSAAQISRKSPAVPPPTQEWKPSKSSKERNAREANAKKKYNIDVDKLSLPEGWKKRIDTKGSRYYKYDVEGNNTLSIKDHPGLHNAVLHARGRAAPVESAARGTSGQTQLSPATQESENLASRARREEEAKRLYDIEGDKLPIPSKTTKERKAREEVAKKMYNIEVDSLELPAGWEKKIDKDKDNSIYYKYDVEGTTVRIKDHPGLSRAIQAKVRAAAQGPRADLPHEIQPINLINLPRSTTRSPHSVARSMAQKQVVSNGRPQMSHTMYRDDEELCSGPACSDNHLPPLGEPINELPLLRVPPSTSPTLALSAGQSNLSPRERAQAQARTNGTIPDPRNFGGTSALPQGWPEGWPEGWSHLSNLPGSSSQNLHTQAQAAAQPPPHSALLSNPIHPPPPPSPQQP